MDELFDVNGAGCDELCQSLRAASEGDNTLAVSSRKLNASTKHAYNQLPAMYTGIFSFQVAISLARSHACLSPLTR